MLYAACGYIALKGLHPRRPSDVVRAARRAMDQVIRGVGPEFAPGVVKYDAGNVCGARGDNAFLIYFGDVELQGWNAADASDTAHTLFRVLATFVAKAMKVKESASAVEKVWKVPYGTRGIKRPRKPRAL